MVNFLEGFSDDLIGFIGHSRFEMLMCWVEQYPEDLERIAIFISRKVIEFERIKSWRWKNV